ncbi:desmocollin 2-like protein isoform X2 [Neoarius graeffei]|uniref:desmocollin 2-like protein isoform X2 n=1 Tax=Neoarius graeffei TaxID=443677 RepID=UPI00298CFFA2|nr:desmocollin 2-like protein isoform X2 [Neoarius graeffei]
MRVYFITDDLRSHPCTNNREAYRLAATPTRRPTAQRTGEDILPRLLAPFFLVYRNYSEFSMFQYGGFCHFLFLLLICYFVESCVQKYIQAQVPEMLEPGYVVSHVNLEDCGVGSLDFTSSDPAFTIQMDGTIQAVRVTMVPEDGKSFWITVQDCKGHRWFVDVNLSLTGQVSNNAVLKRSKRAWGLPPFQIKENDKGPFPKDMDMIASDTSLNYSLYYVIEGSGVDQPPMNLFSITKKGGMLKVHRSIDREQYPKLEFQVRAFSVLTNQETDLPMKVTVIIEDENDNPPQFTGSLDFTVQEQCPVGTVVGQVTATDKDEANTLHTKIKYRLKNGTQLFRIDPSTGVISATTSKLDRETVEKYFLEIEIRDMDGATTGLSSTGWAVVSLGDINDNPPTFTKPMYKGKVLENTADVLVSRIDVNDKDLKNTPNWKAVYEITKGNESGNFSIKTDPVTNDGLIYVTKPLNYEQGSTINLEVIARNEVPLVGTSSSWQKVPVELSVEDVDEGPEFSAPVLKLRVKEGVLNGTVIGTYTATDPETKSSKDIKYYKLTDPGSWIKVMENTGELKTAVIIDRESPLVYNDAYNITVKAVDKSRKTGTGTVVILIEDVNDNAPMITKPDQVLCSKDGARDSILLTAKDLDLAPYSDPFIFELASTDAEQWRLKGATGTSVMLEPAVDLPNNVYNVKIKVKDLQGYGEEQVVSVRICECAKEGVCAPQYFSTVLGVWGILALLLGLLLLLLLCLLCVLACSTKEEKLPIADDDDTAGGMLLKSNLEAPGEEVKDALLLMPGSGVDAVDTFKGGSIPGHQTILSSAGFGQKQTYGSSMYQNTHGFTTTNTLSSGQYNTGMHGNSYRKYATMSTMDGWRENKIPFDTKLAYLREESDGRFAEDILRPYGYEGVGSPAGSVGCCSILSEQESLDFLNSLGPKFKTLAGVCTSKSQGGRP